VARNFTFTTDAQGTQRRQSDRIYPPSLSELWRGKQDWPDSKDAEGKHAGSKTGPVLPHSTPHPGSFEPEQKSPPSRTACKRDPISRVRSSSTRSEERKSESLPGILGSDARGQACLSNGIARPMCLLSEHPVDPACLAEASA